MIWRDHIKVHPAADLFPMMSDAELKELGEDIKKNGLEQPLVFWESESDYFLLDGRNRLDAMEVVGLDVFQMIGKHYAKWGFKIDALSNAVRVLNKYESSCLAKKEEWRQADPYEFVVSANVHRRHLNGEQKRELIAKLLKATPEKSNRQIAEATKTDKNTVKAVRSKMERTGEIHQLGATVGKDGKRRKAPAAKPAKTSAASKPVPAPAAEQSDGGGQGAGPRKFRKARIRQTASGGCFQRLKCHSARASEDRRPHHLHGRKWRTAFVIGSPKGNRCGHSACKRERRAQ
jgi:hypothetical protein